MTTLPPFSKLLSALKLNAPAQAMTSAQGIERAILSLHSVISNPAESPEAVKVSKRLLLRLLENPKIAGYVAETEIPAGILFRAAQSPDSAGLRPFVPRITVARTPSNRKGGAISSAGSSRLARLDIRRGVVTSSPVKKEQIHAGIA